jgi:hypothetical protein
MEAFPGSGTKTGAEEARNKESKSNSKTHEKISTPELHEGPSVTRS